jgi:hypothetical protein
MRIKNFISYFLLLVIMVFSNVVKAHPGGHYSSNEQVVFNIWQLKNGTSIKGNFSFGKDNFIMLENERGSLVKIMLDDLSPQDQKLANFKIKKYEALNEMFGAKNNIISKQENRTSGLWIFISCILGIVAFYFFRKFIVLLQFVKTQPNKLVHVVACFSLFIITVVACKKSTDNVTTPITVIPKTTTGFLDTAFAPFKPAISTSFDNTYYYVSSTGIPAHNMMVGITSWQQQVPIPQAYTGSNSWSIPLQPVYATTPLSTKSNLMKGAVAIGINGIPIFNALNNRGEDAYLIGELDNWGGHCGKGDDYHYHAAPFALSNSAGTNPIAFALDGFAVYGTKEADGSSMMALDTCHGHVGSNGVYHYHGTTNYPYVVGAMKGKVTLDPSTPAPENQILPQAFATPIRPATSPLSGAQITAYTSTGVNAYKLTYKRGTKFGYVDYSWVFANNKTTYIFIQTDTAGTVVQNQYIR